MAAWTNETTATALALLKVDLGILNSTAYDQRLTSIIDATTSAIVREGVSTLSDSTEDIQMVVIYAEWLWRKRDSGEGMPRNLRWLLNNRIMSEKMQEGS